MEGNCSDDQSSIYDPAEDFIVQDEILESVSDGQFPLTPIQKHYPKIVT